MKQEEGLGYSTRPHEYSNSESSRYSLQNFKLYQTQTRYYLIGRDKSHTQWRVLKIDRSEPAELHISEDPAVYTEQEIKDLLSTLDVGNQSCGGVNFVTKAYGIVGFIKFLKPYYMIVITKRQRLGAICGHSIFGIRESRLLQVPHPSVLVGFMCSKAEDRYKKLFNSIDLSKDFFYSHTYRIMWSLQRNVNTGRVENMPFDDMFVWNSFLTREFRNQAYSPHWTVALVHGFFKQVKLDCEGSDVFLTLIARRSRHFAGTRYLKRGVNAKGRVANDVETEQLVYAEKTDQICSIVQHRGSIPLFWSQDTSVLQPKPDIILHKNDPVYKATELHFQNLAARYGNPVVVLNLVKTEEERPREIILCSEFAYAVANLNHRLPKNDRIKFIQCDMHMFKKRPTDLLDVLVSIASGVVDTVGYFYSEKASETMYNLDCSGSSADASNTCDGDQPLPVKRKFQHGVLRSNCIDCLDRTNVSQYAFGFVALGRQMHGLGLCSTTQISCSVAASLMELYRNMGDVIALQYGGSHAHNKVFLQWQGKSPAAIHSQELLRSLIRHYNNAILDGEKQDAINIFLGHFRPEAGKLALWQMDSDNHLQIRKAGVDPTSDPRLSFKRSLSAGNLREQNGTDGISLQVASQMDSNPISKFVGVNPSFNSAHIDTSKSEADLKKRIANDCSFSDVRFYSSMYKSIDSPCGPNDLADADWLSSSGNSWEEDVQERYSVATGGNNTWNLQGSGVLSERCRTAEDSYEPDEYFQDFTSMAKSSSWKQCSNEKREDKEDMDESRRAGADYRFSENFVDWVQNDQTLCF